MGILQILQWAEHYSIVVVFLVFVLILVTTYWPGRKAAVEQYGRMVLDEDQPSVMVGSGPLSVMAGAGPPSTTFPVACCKVVDSAPARTMTRGGRCAAQPTRLIPRGP